MTGRPPDQGAGQLSAGWACNRRITPNASAAIHRRRPGLPSARSGLLPPVTALAGSATTRRTGSALHISSQRNAAQSATTAARYQHAQRAGLCQQHRPQPLAVRPRLALGGAAGCSHTTTGAEAGSCQGNAKKGWRERDDGHGRAIRAASGDAATAPDHARAGCSKALNAKKDPAIAEIAGAKRPVRREEKNRPEGDKRQDRQGRCPTPRRSAVGTVGPKPDQQPLGRPVRMGTMPLTLSGAEPSLAVRVLLVKRTRSLSRSTAVSTASPLAYSCRQMSWNTW